MNLKILLFQEDNIWVCQGLDKDICSQGSTIDEALDRLKWVWYYESKETTWFDIKSAPEILQKRFKGLILRL